MSRRPKLGTYYDMSTTYGRSEYHKAWWRATNGPPVVKCNCHSGGRYSCLDWCDRLASLRAREEYERSPRQARMWEQLEALVGALQTHPAPTADGAPEPATASERR